MINQSSDALNRCFSELFVFLNTNLLPTKELVDELEIIEFDELTKKFLGTNLWWNITRWFLVWKRAFYFWNCCREVGLLSGWACVDVFFLIGWSVGEAFFWTNPNTMFVFAGQFRHFALNLRVLIFWPKGLFRVSMDLFVQLFFCGHGFVSLCCKILTFRGKIMGNTIIQPWKMKCMIMRI